MIRQLITVPGLLLSGLSLSLAACASYVPLDPPPSAARSTRVESAEQTLPAWPLHEPRVRLERVIAYNSDLGGRRWRRRLSGEADERLFARPHGVTWRQDALFVADPGAGQIVRLSADGRIRRSTLRQLVSPIGVAACGDGVVVSDSATGKLWQLDPDLEEARLLAEGLLRPTGVECSGDEILVVETGRHRLLSLPVENHSVVEVNQATVALGRRGEAPGEFNFPTVLTLFEGTLWVGDTLNFRLQRFALGERPVTEAAPADGFGQLGDRGGDLPRIKGLAIDARGRLWVSDAHLDQVALFTRDGTWLMSLGHSGWAAGEFAFPAGIAAHPDGRVAVVDSLNRRVQVFRLTESVRAGHAP